MDYTDNGTNITRFDGEGGYEFTSLQDGDPFGFSVPNRAR